MSDPKPTGPLPTAPRAPRVGRAGVDEASAEPSLTLEFKIPTPLPKSLAEAAQELSVRQRRLVICEGPNVGRVFEPTARRVVIGSHESADLVLNDRMVSRLHCEVVLGEPSTVRDLGSLNGTLINGVAVTQAPLADDAVLTVGTTKLRVEASDADVAVALSERTEFGSVIGRSPIMRAVFAVCEQAAASDSTLLIEGETGTGKEAIAESIHRESKRKHQPFLVVDCGAIPANLLETELFGHARGSFTGAVAARKGAFEHADGGTILLDEIGELSLELQPKILRVIERREVKPVGQNNSVRVDVRVMAATHKKLAQEVTAHRFRADLYYRLAVLRVHVPALRERKDDLPWLVESLLGTLGVAPADAGIFKTSSFQYELAQHSWPGNIRELRNYLERCAASSLRQSPLGELGASPEADADEPPPQIDLEKTLREGRDEWVAMFERRYLTALMNLHADNVAAAARASGIDRISLYRLLWKHGLKEKSKS